MNELFLEVVVRLKGNLYIDTDKTLAKSTCRFLTIRVSIPGHKNGRMFFERYESIAMLQDVRFPDEVLKSICDELIESIRREFPL